MSKVEVKNAFNTKPDIDKLRKELLKDEKKANGGKIVSSRKNNGSNKSLNWLFKGKTK